MDSKYLHSFHYVVKSEKFSAAVDSILRSPLVAICDPPTRHIHYLPGPMTIVTIHWLYTTSKPLAFTA